MPDQSKSQVAARNNTPIDAKSAVWQGQKRQRMALNTIAFDEESNPTVNLFQESNHLK
tara:strand:+ start:437 stop:610 length:174 start_codon:yes stop_codon:yes gene_type:complete